MRLSPSMTSIIVRGCTMSRSKSQPGRDRPAQPGVQAGGQALRTLHTHGVEVRKKRPRGGQVSPLDPLSCSPRSEPGSEEASSVKARSTAMMFGCGGRRLMSDLGW
jgi:hypothetical protein